MTSQVFKKPLPYLAVIFAHMIWGANFVVAKLTLQELPAMSLSFSRFFLGLIFILPFLLAEKKHLDIKLSELPKLFIIGSLMITFNIALFYAGLVRTTVIQASALSLIVPLLSVLTGWWFLKEKVYTINLVGIATSLTGALFIIGVPFLFFGTLNTENLFGNLLLILGSITWVAGATLSKTVLKRHSALDLTAIIFLVGAVTFFIPALSEYLQNPTFITKITTLGGLGLMYIVFLSSISAFFLFEWGVETIGIIESSLFQYIEPIVASLLGIFVLGEQARLSFLIGGVLIAIGAYWGTLGKAEHHRHHKAHRT